MISCEACEDFDTCPLGDECPIEQMMVIVSFNTGDVAITPAHDMGEFTIRVLYNKKDETMEALTTLGFTPDWRPAPGQ